jgi:hypothetical protein
MIFDRLGNPISRGCILAGSDTGYMYLITLITFSGLYRGRAIRGLRLYAGEYTSLDVVFLCYLDEGGRLQDAEVVYGV